MINQITISWLNQYFNVSCFVNSEHNNDNLNKKNVFILDTGSTKHITNEVFNLTYVSDYFSIKINNVHGKDNNFRLRKGTLKLKGFGEALLIQTCPINIISLTVASERFNVKYIQEKEIFEMESKSQPNLSYIFKLNKSTKLYELCQYTTCGDTDAVHQSSKISHSEPATVLFAKNNDIIPDSNKKINIRNEEKLSKPTMLTSQESLKKYIINRLHLILSHPSKIALKDTLTKCRTYQHLNITASDIDKYLDEECMGCLSNKFYGKLAAVTNKNPEYIGEHVFGDIFFIGHEYMFLITVDDYSNSIQACHLTSKNANALFEGIKNINNVYKQYGHKIVKLYFDGESGISKINNRLKENEITLIVSESGNHIHKVERKLRELKEKIASTLNTLCFKLPVLLLPKLVYWVVESINITTSTTISERNHTPRELFTNTSIINQYALKLNFGDVILSRCHKIGTNKMNTNAEMSIVCGRDLNSNGVVQVLSLNTLKILKRRQYYLQTWNQHVVNHVNKVLKNFKLFDHRVYIKDAHMLNVMLNENVQLIDNSDFFNDHTKITKKQVRFDPIINIKPIQSTIIERDESNIPITDDEDDDDMVIEYENDDQAVEDVRPLVQDDGVLIPENPHIDANENNNNNNNDDANNININIDNPHGMPIDAVNNGIEHPNQHVVDNDHYHMMNNDTHGVNELPLDQIIENENADGLGYYYDTKNKEKYKICNILYYTKHKGEKQVKIKYMSKKGRCKVIEQLVPLGNIKEVDDDFISNIPHISNVHNYYINAINSNLNSIYMNKIQENGRDHIAESQVIENLDAQHHENKSKHYGNLTIKKACEIFGRKDTDGAVCDELSKVHEMEVLKPIHPNDYTQDMWSKTMIAFNFLKEKSKSNGEFIKLKNRLTVNGARQPKSTYDPDDKDAPTVRKETMLLLYNLISYYRLKCATMDIGNAFLHAYNPFEAYVKLDNDTTCYLVNMYPNVYKNNVAKDKSGNLYLICKMQKALYGMINSPKLFNNKISKDLLDYGFKQSIQDPCLYYKGDMKSQNRIFLSLHVDDLMCAADQDKDIQGVYDYLNIKYKKVAFNKYDNINGLDYLNINVKIDENNIVTLSQFGQIEKVLSKYYNSIDDKIGYVSPAKSKLFKSNVDNENDNIDNKINESNNNMIIKDEKIVNEYLAILMSVSYLTFARVDLSTTVSYLATRTHKLTKQDFIKLKRLLGYLLRTKHYTLNLKPKTLELIAYVDSSHASHEDLSSHTGYVVSLGPIENGYNGLIMVNSNKQTSFSLSSCESEIVGILNCSNSIVWWRELLKELNVGNIDSTSTTVLNDNRSAITMLNSGTVNFKRSKHVNLKVKYLNNLIKTKLVKLEYRESETLIADYFTKPLNGAKFREYVKLMLNMKNM